MGVAPMVLCGLYFLSCIAWCCIVVTVINVIVLNQLSSFFLLFERTHDLFDALTHFCCMNTVLFHRIYHVIACMCVLNSVYQISARQAQ